MKTKNKLKVVLVFVVALGGIGTALNGNFIAALWVIVYLMALLVEESVDKLIQTQELYIKTLETRIDQLQGRDK